MAAALVLYPNNTLTIPVNVNDRIEVTYDTAWPQTNLTMLCRAATASIYVYYNMPDNPLAARGAYLTPSIQLMKFGIQQWPADCVFRLTRYGNDSVNADGTRFRLTSADIAARTFMISSTIGLSTTTASTATTTASATSAATTNVASSSVGRAQETGSPSQSSDSTSQGLSKAASAGIGAGVTFGVLLIVAGIVAFIFYTRRRKRNQRLSPPASGTESGKGGYGYNYAKVEVQGDSPNYSALHGSTAYSGPLVEKYGVQRVEADDGYKAPQQRHHELA